MLRSRLENLETAIRHLKCDCAQEYREHITEGDPLSHSYFIDLAKLQDLIAEHAIVQYMVDQKWYV